MSSIRSNIASLVVSLTKPLIPISSPPFSVLNLTDLYSWHDMADSSDAAKMTVDGSDRTSKVFDISETGGDKDIINTVETNQPLSNQITVNSLNTVEFDGVNDSLFNITGNYGDLINGEDIPITLAFVMGWKTTPLNICLAIAASAGTSPQFNFEISGGDFRFAKRGFPDAPTVTANIGDPDAGNANAYVVRVNGTTIDIWKNGTQIITGGAFDAASMSLMNRFSVGSRFANTNSKFANCFFGEIIITSSALPTAEVNQLNTYLGNRWNL